MESYNSLISSDKFLDRSQLRSYLVCLFGPLKHNETVAQSFDSRECNHHGYQGLMRVWNKTVHAWMKQEAVHAQVNQGRDAQDALHMKVVIMVRDPFDRLRSYFDYVVSSSHNDFWKEMMTEEQHKRVRARDFAGWLHLLYSEKLTPHGTQYEYIDDDVDKAIAAVTGESPKVIPLVSECFVASLRLMEKEFSFKTGAVDEFMHSAYLHSNPSEKSNATESLNLDELRERSKQYFPEEYRFYNVAVEQMKRHLDGTQLLHLCDL